MKQAIIITTINPSTKAIDAILKETQKNNIPLVIIGDTKTPEKSYHNFEHFYSIERQIKEFPDFCQVLPVKHYSRKNIGYLVAMKLGVEDIRETDDDNIPLPEFWHEIPLEFEVDEVSSQSSWFNVYSFFSNQRIWPRGFPLQYIQDTPNYQLLSKQTQGLIVQDLANNNPDVDAIYRLTSSLPFDFIDRPPVMLKSGNWCPFNSQNTVFRKIVFPLLYLPSKCSFRMTDIWRSFIAQRCLWELGEGIVFRKASVFQERNEHNLLKDFEDEISGYLLNDKICSLLEYIHLDQGDMIRSLMLCYETLIKNSILPSDEMPILQAWCYEVESLL